MFSRKPITGGEARCCAPMIPRNGRGDGISGQEQDFCANPGQEQTAARPDAGRAQAGFSLTELLVVVFIIGLLSAIAISKILDSLEKGRLARCKSELRGIQEEVWDAYVDNGTFLDPTSYWEIKWGGKKPGPYFYLVDTDPDVEKGAGTDLDGVAEAKSGESGGADNKKDVKFVVLCQHDHKQLADYVYLVDDGPPTIANMDHQPGYERFIR